MLQCRSKIYYYYFIPPVTSHFSLIISLFPLLFTALPLSLPYLLASLYCSGTPPISATVWTGLKPHSRSEATLLNWSTTDLCLSYQPVLFLIQLWLVLFRIFFFFFFGLIWYLWVAVVVGCSVLSLVVVVLGGGFFLRKGSGGDQRVILLVWP